MPSPFASALASPLLNVKQEQDQQEPSTASTLRRLPPHSPEDLIIAWVDLTVIPLLNPSGLQLPGQAKAFDGVEYINHLRASWPSHPSAAFAHRDLRFELMGSSNSATGDDHVIVKSATVGGRAIHFSYQLSDLGSAWSRLVVVSLPDEGLAAGEVLDVVYTVRRKGSPRGMAKYSLLLPCFASTVARMNISVLCPAGTS